MKKIFVTLVFAAGLLNTTIAQDKKKETIQGNGKLATRDVTVTTFDAMNVSGIFELKISQGAVESVKLEGDEDLLAYISVRNDGSKLIVDMDKLKDKNANFKIKNKLKVYVTFNKLKEIELNMVGNVHSTEELSFNDLNINNQGVGNLDFKLSANSFNLNNKGVGNVTISGKAQQASITNTGVGSMNAGNFSVQTMNIQNTGIGSAEINAEKEVKVKSTGLGNITNRGAAPMPRKNRTIVI